MRLDDLCILYIDGGTTRTRAWAAVGDRVVASESMVAGARDGARESSMRPLREVLARLAREIAKECDSRGQSTPALAVAAGMITSAEGLVEVAHVEAPAGARELARGAVCRREGDLASLPVVFVPGVRSGPARPGREAIGASDVMRGEEALALGLVRRGHLEGGGVVLSLGSHWKAVHVDAEGRVARSVSTLTGEMIHAVQERTILASAVPRDWPATLPGDWVRAGRRRALEDGLSRALYCVRLLQQGVASEASDRLAFLVGAAVAGDETALLPAGSGTRRVVLVGRSALVGAWRDLLRERDLESVALEEDEREAAFRAGCRAVIEEGRLESVADGTELNWFPPS